MDESAMKPKYSADDQIDLLGFTEQEQALKLTAPDAIAYSAGPRRYHPKSDRQQTDCIGFQLDDLVAQDSSVRAIDVFVDHLDLASLGFKHSGGNYSAGQPPYDPASLVRLYLYGYLNQVRSGRRLAQACRVNVEVMWLIQRQTPQYHTIHKFRAENSEVLVQVHADFKMLYWCESKQLSTGTSYFNHK